MTMLPPIYYMLIAIAGFIPIPGFIGFICIFGYGWYAGGYIGGYIGGYTGG
jgi:hypothetical protein